MPRLPPWVALIACSLLVVSFLFPPFLEVPRLSRHSPSFAGFQLIFDISSSNDLALDFKTLLVEWLGIVLLAVGLSYVRVSRMYLRRVAVGAGVVLLVGLSVWLFVFFGTPDTRLSKSQFINPFLRDESALAGQTTPPVVNEPTEKHPWLTDPLVADRGLPGHYSTSGNAKAKELEVSFDFPTDWRGAEGKRPNTFYAVTSKDGRGGEMCSLVIKDAMLPPDVTPTKQDLAESFAPEGLRDFLPDGATFLGGDRTTLDGEPGAWVNFVQNANVVGLPIRIMGVNFFTYYDTRLIIFGCGVGNDANLPMQDLQRKYRATLPTFQQMANSLVIHNKWRNRVESGAPSVKAH